MSNASDFVIENGVLKKYNGHDGNVVIPEGVTNIGDEAFRWCGSLTSVTIPDSVTSIGNYAFDWCFSLKRVTIPDGVTSIGYEAFRGCKKLADTAGLVIVKGVLYDYNGPGGDVTIPDGVTSIGNYAFDGCKKLTSVTIPESVTRIGKEAFSGCSSLTSISLSESAFKAFTAFTDAEFKNTVLVKNVWCAIGAVWQAAFFLTRQGKSLTSSYVSLIGEEDAARIGEAILEKLQKTASVKECNAAAGFMTMFCAKLPGDLLRHLYQALRAQKNGKKAMANLEQNAELRMILAQDETNGEEQATDPFSAFMLKQKLTSKELEVKLKAFYLLNPEDCPILLSAEGEAVPVGITAFLLTAHERLQTYYYGQSDVKNDYEKPGLCPEAAELVALLDPKSLQTTLKQLADEYLFAYQNTKKKYLAYPFCRYADEANMAELTKRAPKWSTSVSGNNAPPLLQLRDAVKYSNTRAAMVFAERYGELGEYAKLRGMTEDELRDKYLSDVGLDEQGGKAYDLGSQIVTARLQKDLSFLFELPGGKTAKSLPKKGADPEKYEAAKADFEEMRKAVRKIVKSRGDKLFLDFLGRKSRKAQDWQAAYLKNPLLRGVAELVVWKQSGKTFILADSKPIDSGKQPYTITGAPITVAHPMEMEPDEVKSWQKYFTCHGLKQPFLQVWEPVIDPATIKEDRYAGSVQPMYRFSGKDKHGIHSRNLHAYSVDIGFSMDGCKLDYKASTWRIDYDGADGETYTLGKFSFKKYTRQVNHIVALLDGWTVEDRIRKDDTSVADRFDAFTLAQIMGFIAAAQEAQAVNVLALLLDYKNTHFADFDPMDEFTLE